MKHSSAYIFHGIFACLALLLFALALNNYLLFSLVPQVAPYDIKRLLILGLILLLNLWLLSFQSLRDQALNTFLSFKKSTRYYLLIFLLLGLVSSILAPLHRYAFLQVAFYFELFVVSLTIIALRQKFERFDQVIALILMASFTLYLLTSVYELVRVFSGQLTHVSTVKYVLTYFGFVNERFFAQVITWSFPLMILSFFVFQSRWLKALAVILAIFLVYLGVAQQSRALFVESIALLVLGFALIKFNRKWLFILVLSLLIGTLVYFAIFESIAYFTSIKFSASSHLLVTGISGRLALWKLALILVKFHPLFGVGPMHFTYYSMPNLKYPEAHPHDIWLLIATEWGLLALVVAIRLTVGMVVSWVKTLKHNIETNTHKMMTFSLTAAWIAFFLHSAVSGVMTTPISTFLFAVTLGWSISVSRENTALSTNTHRAFQWFGIFLVIIAILVIAYGCYPYVSNFSAQYSNYIHYCQLHFNGKPCQFGPNFWQQGWIKFY